MASSGSTKKPFTYCPGGINFNELKSPRMARRIAKHQEQIPDPKSLTSEGVISLPKEPPSVQKTTTLPTPERGATKPSYNRQRSISDLLSCSDTPPTPPSIPSYQKNDTTTSIFSYNPYNPDRSLSIPPPSPQPARHAATAALPDTRSNSVPPSAAGPEPPRNQVKASMQAPKARPGLPPPHPSMQGQQLLEGDNQSQALQTSSSNGDSSPQKIPISSNTKAAESLMDELVFAPPPPPPPPPPLPKLNNVDNPYTGSKPVKFTKSIDELRKNQEIIEAPSFEEVRPKQSIQNQQQPARTQPAVSAITPTNTKPSLDMFDLNDSIDAFEQQRQTMLADRESPKIFNDFCQESPRNVNIVQEASLLHKTGNTPPQQNIESDIQPSIPQTVQEINLKNKPDTGVGENNKVSEPKGASRNSSPARKKVTISAKVVGPNEKPNDDINLNKMRENSVPRQLSLQKDADQTNVFARGRQEHLNYDDEVTEINNPNNTVNTVRYRPPSPCKPSPVRFTPTPKVVGAPQNSFNGLSAQTKEHNPWQQGLLGTNASVSKVSQIFPSSSTPVDNFQPSFQPKVGNMASYNGGADKESSMPYPAPASNVNASYPQKVESNLQGQEAMNATAMNMKQQISTSASLNAPATSVAAPRRETTPQKVPYSSNAKASNKIIDSSMEDKQPLPKQPFNAPMRNVSDSGISDSATPEPDEMAGRIITNQMQKIEAQMKKILESESTPPIQDSSSKGVELSKVNKPMLQESQQSSFDTPAQDQAASNYSTMSGYSTCSEEELKFGETNSDTLVKTAPFEIMEEFEEAPAEFDLGISSYSISHPIEKEVDLEKTPVPEVADSDNYSTLSNSTLGKNSGDKPSYRVTTPSEEVNNTSVPRREASSQFARNDGHIPVNNQGFSQPAPMLSPFCPPPPMPMFNQMSPMPPMPSMPSMFDQMPSVFDNTFMSNGFFNSPFPASPMSSASPNVSSRKAAEPSNSAKEERVIPIQIIRSKTSQNVDKSQKVNENNDFGQRNSSMPIKVEIRNNPKDLNTGSSSSSQSKDWQYQNPPPPQRNAQQQFSPAASAQTRPTLSSSLPSPAASSPPAAPTLPRASAASPAAAAANTPFGAPRNAASGVVGRNATMSPTSALLQSEAAGDQQRPRRSFSRSSSVTTAAGRETPLSFRDLQVRYGSPTTPTDFVMIAGKTPLNDIDYQKTARQSVVGELSSYGGVRQASRITGPRRRPSQSPSMKLLGMLHVHDDPNDPVTDCDSATSQEYRGDQGRFMPPPNRAGSHTSPFARSISSQL